jgi:ribosomal protein L11 methylase PrmA
VEFVTTPNDVVDRMLELAYVGPEDVVYDLGCGDGRIVVAAAKKYGCRAVGFELDRLRVREARENALKNGVAGRVTIELRDALKVDLRPATVVTLYLGTELNARLVPQLEQLAPGSRIVSHDFGIEGFPADKTIRMTSREDNRDHLIHLWNCPIRAAR